MSFDYCAVKFDDMYNVISINNNSTLRLKAENKDIPEEINKMCHKLTLRHKKSKSSTKLTSLHSNSSPKYYTINGFTKSKKFLSNPDLIQTLEKNKEKLDDKTETKICEETVLKLEKETETNPDTNSVKETILKSVKETVSNPDTNTEKETVSSSEASPKSKSETKSTETNSEINSDVKHDQHIKLPVCKKNTIKSQNSSPKSISTTPSPLILNETLTNSLDSSNKIDNQYILYQQLFNTFNNTFDFRECFKKFFLDMIDNHIKIYDIDLVFNAFIFSFILDVKIMNNENYIKYNKFSSEEKIDYIKKVVNHIINFYKNDIIELMKYNLYNHNISYVNSFDIFYKLHFIDTLKKKSHIENNFKQLCFAYSLIRRPLVYHFVGLNPLTEINRIVSVYSRSEKPKIDIAFNTLFENFLIDKYKPYNKDYDKYAKLYIFGDYLYKNDKHIYDGIDFQLDYRNFLKEIPDIDEPLLDNDEYND